MSITEAVIEKLRTLSAEDQEKVLKFVEALQPTRKTAMGRRDPEGMFADRGIHLTAEDLEEARRAMWANFPRDFPEGDTP
jgi:hypothetical protein